MEYNKENNKRNSKTFKRVVGHNMPYKFNNNELIKIQGNTESFTRFVRHHLPHHHQEATFWQNTVSYSLKKNGRWKLLSEIDRVWREESEAIAALEEDIIVESQGPCSHHSEEGGFRGLYRNHGQLVTKTRLRKSHKGLSRLEKWSEGDPSKVEIIKGRNKPGFSHCKSSVYLLDLQRNDVHVIIKSHTGKVPSKAVLSSKASDKYTRRSCRFNKGYPAKDVPLLMEEYEDTSTEEFSPNVYPVIRRETPFIMSDYLIEKKIAKSKRNSSSKVKQYEVHSQRKGKTVYQPFNDFPISSIDHGIQEMEEDTEPISEAQIHKLELQTFDVPSGWQVSYSNTSPTVCEVWKRDSSILFLQTEYGILGQINSTSLIDSFALLKNTGLLELCNKLDARVAKSHSISQDVDFFHLEDAHRYISSNVEIYNNVSIETLSTAETDMVAVCEICLEECDNSTLVGPCHHIYCGSCWARWLASDAGGKGKCPHPDCDTSIDLVALHWLAGQERYRSIKRAMIQSRLDTDPLLHQCRFCKRLARRHDIDVKTISCPCGLHYCAQCGHADHAPASCQELAKYIKYSSLMETYRSLETEVLVRQCPKCGQFWEKMWGCNHMVCGACQTAFCWGCGGDGSKHNSHYWCGQITVPLEKKEITPLPTEIVLIKQLELFQLHASMKMKRFKRDCTFQEDWLESIRIQFKRCFNVIRFGLLCDKTFVSKRKSKALKNGALSVIQLQDVLCNQPRHMNAQWKNLVMLYLNNIVKASKYCCSGAQSNFEF